MSQQKSLFLHYALQWIPYQDFYNLVLTKRSCVRQNGDAFRPMQDNIGENKRNLAIGKSTVRDPNPMLEKQRRRLSFDLKGTTLFHSSRDNLVEVWDVASWKCRYAIHPGVLIGISRDGETFLTHRAHRHYQAWDTATGSELVLASISPETYQFHQRTTIFTDSPELTLQVYDVLEKRPSQAIDIPSEGMPVDIHDPELQPILWNWAIAPNDRYIAVVLLGGFGGHDWAAGQCIDLNTGKQVYTFEVDRFLDCSPIYFSDKHNLMISGGSTWFTSYDLTTGKRFRKIWVGGDGGSIVSTSPTKRWLVATNAASDRELPGSRPSNIRLIDTRSSSSRGKVKRVIEGAEQIEDLAFHPDGKHIASLLESGKILIWNIITGKREATLW